MKFLAELIEMGKGAPDKNATTQGTGNQNVIQKAQLKQGYLGKLNGVKDFLAKVDKLTDMTKEVVSGDVVNEVAGTIAGLLYFKQKNVPLAELEKSGLDYIRDMGIKKAPKAVDFIKKNFFQKKAAIKKSIADLTAFYKK